MLKLSLKEGQYVNIGDDIRIVFAGGTGKHCRLLIDAPKELNIARSNNEPDPAKRKDTYYPEPEFSSEAKKQIKQIHKLIQVYFLAFYLKKQITKSNNISCNK